MRKIKTERAIDYSSSVFAAIGLKALAVGFFFPVLLTVGRDATACVIGLDMSFSGSSFTGIGLDLTIELESLFVPP